MDLSRGDVAVDHLSDWSAWGWLGGLALLLIACAWGALAVFSARLAFWRWNLGTGPARWWLLGAAVAWGLSIWLLIESAADLARHSRTTSFAGWFWLLGVGLIAATYWYAAVQADRVEDDLTSRVNTPHWLLLVWIIPAAVAGAIGIGVLCREITLRGQWGEALLRLLLALMFGAAMSGVAYRVVKWQNERNRAGYY